MTAPALLSSGTTPARAALTYGTDTFAKMSTGKLRRVYRAAAAVLLETFDDGQEIIDWALEMADCGTLRTAVIESPVRPRGSVEGVVRTHAIVSALVDELCAGDRVHIPASPSTREFDSFEGGYTVHHASDRTTEIVSRVMGA